MAWVTFIQYVGLKWISFFRSYWSRPLSVLDNELNGRFSKGGTVHRRY